MIDVAGESYPLADQQKLDLLQFRRWVTPARRETSSRPLGRRLTREYLHHQPVRIRLDPHREIGKHLRFEHDSRRANCELRNPDALEQGVADVDRFLSQSWSQFSIVQVKIDACGIRQTVHLVLHRMV